MKEHTVIAEMIDRHTGQRHFPGAPFTPVDEEQRKRLSDAGCIREGVDPAAQQRDQINNDGLFDKTVADLKDIAKAEEVDLGDASRKDDIVAAIRTKRAAA